MKSSRVIAFFVATLLLSPLTYSVASPTVSQTDVNEMNQESIPEASPTDKVADAIDDWFDEKGITQGIETSGGKLYYSSYKRVSVNSSNAGWSKARRNAFEKAMLQLQSDFVKDHYGRTYSKTMKKYFADDSSDNYEFPGNDEAKSQLGALWDKLVAAGEAKMDAVLRDQGIDPSQFDAIPPAERKDLFVSEFVTKTITEGMGDISGFLPVKTFEGNDSNGNHAVGVIAVYSPKFKQLAYDIAYGKPPMTAGKKGQPLSSWYDLPSDALAQTFGVRLAVDEAGEVALLSFGQAGYSYQGNNYQREERAKETAGKMAEMNADQQICTFLNSTLSFSNEADDGEKIKHQLIKKGDQITETDVTAMISKISEEATRTCNASMTGTRRVKRWSYEHPYGQNIVGRVRMWTRAGYESSQEVKNFKPTNNTSSSGSMDGNKAKSMESDVSESPEFADPEDFF